MYKVGIVLLNFHSSSFFLEIFNNIKENIGLPDSEWLFLLIDNSESSKEEVVLRSMIKNLENVKYFSIPNLGYANGNNYGLKYLKSENIPYGLIVNPDILFETKNFFYNFKLTIELNKKIAVVGPVVYNSDRSICPNLSVLNLSNSIYSIVTKTKEKDPKAVYATVGCCLFMSINKISQINYLDERTFLYREEQILAELLINNDYVWYVTPNVEIVHNHVRKIKSYLSFFKHRKFEFQSTRLYFKEYRKKGQLFMLVYAISFLGKSLLYLFLITLKKIF